MNNESSGQLLVLLAEKLNRLTKDRSLSLVVFSVGFLFVLILSGFIKYALGISISSTTLLWLAWLLAMLTFQFGARITVSIGIIFLLSLPLVPVSGEEARVLTLATNAFFFLFVGTTQQLFALLKGGEREDETGF